MSKKSMSSRNSLKAELMLDSKSFHLRQNFSLPIFLISFSENKNALCKYLFIVNLYIGVVKETKLKGERINEYQLVFLFS